MISWILLILASCGPGCYEVSAREYTDRAECKRQEIQGGMVWAQCVRRVTY
jgi:hypothetical protein